MREVSIDVTIRFDFNETTISLPDENAELTIKLWDVAGVNSSEDLIAEFSEHADMIIVSYSIDRKKTYDDIDDWLELIERNTHSRVLPLALIATKNDLERSVPFAHG